MIPDEATWVRFPRFVGDAAMQLPVLRLLRQMGVGPLVVWGPAATVALVQGHELADFAVPETARPGALRMSKFLKNSRALRSIHFPKSLRPAIAAWLAGVPERVGVSDGGAKMFNTCHAPFWKAKGHFVARYHAALKKCWPELPPMPFAAYSPTTRADKEPGSYICLMPGSVWPSKAWPAESFCALAAKARAFGLEPVVLGSLSEMALGGEITKAGGLNLCGQTDLREASAWLSGAHTAVGNDSGLTHLAAACGTRAIALFGPTDPSASAPWGPKTIALKPENMGCSPCFKRRCPLAAGNCLADISPDQVWERVIGV